MRKFITTTFDFIGIITGILVVLVVFVIFLVLFVALLGLIFKGLDYGLTILNIK